MQCRSCATRPGGEPGSKPVPRTGAHLIPVLSPANRYFDSWQAQCRRSERSSSRKWRPSAHPNDNVVAGHGGTDVTSRICIVLGAGHGRCLLVVSTGSLGRNQTELKPHPESETQSSARTVIFSFVWSSAAKSSPESPKAFGIANGKRFKSPPLASAP